MRPGTDPETGRLVQLVHGERCSRHDEVAEPDSLFCWYCVLEVCRCPGCGEVSLEIWMVHDELWGAAGLRPDDGLWCRPCFERLIGRRLACEDFEPDVLCNEWLMELIPPAAQLALLEEPQGT